ncbi:MAG: hypothetical protein JW959_14655 [Pirellulales bacterium]|nr:hypothetical protein [Pirellulales bacterium]
MHIAYIQFAPALADLEATLERLRPFLEKCANADLIVLPELCNSGYNFSSRKQAAAAAEPYRRSRFIDVLVEHCRQRDCRVVSGFNERDGDTLFNAAVLIGPDGPLGRYRKLHLFKDEKDIFAPGDLGLPVFDVGMAKIGMLVCFDWIFPETWRVLTLRGAEIICHAANLVLPGMAQRAVPVQAMMNRVFVVTANRVGAEGRLTFTGASLIVDPLGEVLAAAPQEGPHAAVVEINPLRARDKMVTPRNHLISDRRPAEYAALVKSPE